MSKTKCACGCGAPPALKTPIRTLSTTITWRDTLGGWRVRWGIGRMRYRIDPGLYRIGQPGPSSPVLVTANYKLSVDALRRHLAGLDLWLLVLDTKGVNVWCSAGKGTFSAEEIARRIEATGLTAQVQHRNLILPQLSATGVAAHEVKRLTGFSVHYGPVRARDLREYLAAGMRATPAMRRVSFDWKDRLVLTPVELANAWKHALVILAALAVLDFIHVHQFTADAIRFLGAMLVGGVLVPLLLPWLPSKAFSLKGTFAGAAWAALAVFAWPMPVLERAGTALLITAIVSYMALNFTGATTFTTHAGARLEVRRALPLILVSAAAGAILRVAAAFV
jgi:hypothetical protein